MNRLSKFKLPFLLTISLSAVFPQAGLKIKADNVQVQEDESVKINVLKNDNIEDKSNVAIEVVSLSLIHI